MSRFSPSKKSLQKDLCCSSLYRVPQKYSTRLLCSATPFKNYNVQTEPLEKEATSNSVKTIVINLSAKVSIHGLSPNGS